MAIIGNDEIGSHTIDSGPTPLVTDKVIGPGTEGSFGIGYLDASGGEVITEMHFYCRTRDSTDVTAEAAIYTYDRQHNDQDFNGVPEDLFSDIEELSPAVTKTAGWKSITGLNIQLNDDDYCMCCGRADGDSIIYYGDDLWAVSLGTDSNGSLVDPWSHNNFDQAFNQSAYFVYTEAPAGERRIFITHS